MEYVGVLNPFANPLLTSWDIQDMKYTINWCKVKVMKSGSRKNSACPACGNAWCMTAWLADGNTKKARLGYASKRDFLKIETNRQTNIAYVQQCYSEFSL